MRRLLPTALTTGALLSKGCGSHPTHTEAVMAAPLAAACSSSSVLATTSVVYNPTRMFSKKQREASNLRKLAPKQSFSSSKLEDYLDHYWCVMFCVHPADCTRGASSSVFEMERYLRWYGARFKNVSLQHHPNGQALIQQLRLAHAQGEAEHPPGRRAKFDLPLVFVNKALVGTISDLKDLEARRLLKDIIHFGFKWKTGGNPTARGAYSGVSEEVFRRLPMGVEKDRIDKIADDNPMLKSLPSLYGDTEAFKGRYRGTPVLRPIQMLPQISPNINVDSE